MPQEDDVLSFTKQDNNTRTQDVFLSVTDMDGNIYINQTGRLSITSSRNNTYIMIVYDYYSNIINAECLKSRSWHILKADYEKINKLLRSRYLKPRIHLLDRECV